jgi:hypothetical protein
MTLIRATVTHRLPGRTRLRLAADRGDLALFDRIVARLSEAPGVLRVRANPRTGSILVEHEGEFGDVAGFAREHGLFDMAEPEAAGSPDLRPVRAVPVHPAAIAAVTFAAMSVYQAGRGRWFSNATASFWQGYIAYAFLKRPWLAVAFAAGGLVQLARGKVVGPAAPLLLNALSAGRIAREADHGDIL